MILLCSFLCNLRLAFHNIFVDHWQTIGSGLIICSGQIASGLIICSGQIVAINERYDNYSAVSCVICDFLFTKYA